MLNTKSAAELVVLQLPHTVRSFPPTREPLRPFGVTPQLLPSDFVARLLLRAERSDSSYDPQLNYALSVVAGWSYSDGVTLSNRLKYYGFPFNTVDEIRVTNPAMSIVASAFLIRSECGKVGVLSFRGTEPDSAPNWLGDVDFSLRAFRGGQVHSGFYANLQAIWDDIYGRLNAATADPERPMEVLFLTGHSLGGAMAVLAAAKIFADEGPLRREMVRGVYTFGQPAVGDANFAVHNERLFGQILHRHTFGEDLVPRMPPRSTGEFVHFGQPRRSRSVTMPWAVATGDAPRQARLATSAVLAGLASFVTRRLPALAGVSFAYSMDDHSPTKYIETSRTSIVG